MQHTATYSPDDNKLRLYPACRLSQEEYNRAKQCGYRWAPMQKLFYAVWCPAAEDFALELAEEIGDEDTSLVERAEVRADRFEGYSDNRERDAERARAAVKAIADNIPFGQPILVGHHSEKRARRDAAKIDNGMRKAVRMWETSKYWTDRAASALHHAKYLERPDVRARRIKKIEAEKRKIERSRQKCVKFLDTYRDPEALKVRLKDGRELVRALLGTYEGGLSFEEQRQYERGELPFEQALETAVKHLSGSVAWCDRWIAHYDNRLAYERAMLQEQGGTETDQKKPEKGGACKCWASPRGGWSYVVKVNRVSITVLDNWGNGGRNFTRVIPFDKLSDIMSAAEVQQAREDGRLVECEDKTGFHLTDAPLPKVKQSKEPDPKEKEFQGMRETLKTGVQVTSVPQLFPTPRDLAARMVELAEIAPGHRVLEPSAGLGSIIGAMGAVWREQGGELVAVEINQHLANRLEREFPLTKVVNADFLQCNGDLGQFDRVLMNPPFVDTQDVDHIRHALLMVKSGGRLVALCANGPRQREKLLPIIEERGGQWIDLPAGSFKASGTMANVALLVIPG